ncbi:MAG: hypothetical protein ACLSWI_00135 [Candidatus Gastranaerophilaceae bacterium]
MIIDLLKKSVKITNDNIILAIPLILFMWIINFYSLFSKYTVDTIPEMILATVTVLFMVGAFLAGWFYMIKKAVELSKKVFVLDSDRAKETLNLIKLIPTGIGKYFLSFVGMYSILFLIQVLVSLIVFSIGIHSIGTLDPATVQQIQTFALDQTKSSELAMVQFIDSLTPQQIAFLGKWSLLFMAVSTTAFFIIMLWLPEIMYKSPNPFVALWRAIKKLFKTFFKSLTVFASMWIIGFILLFINTFAFLNPFTYLIMSIILFYYTVYVMVLLFVYYDETFNNNLSVEENLTEPTVSDEEK